MGLHAVQALDDWCSPMTVFSYVDRLQRACGKTKLETKTYFDSYANLLCELTEIQLKAEEELVALRAHSGQKET